MFLGISQNSQENTCANFIKKETLQQMFSCEFCEISKNTFFIEHLLWLLLNSGKFENFKNSLRLKEDEIRLYRCTVRISQNTRLFYKQQFFSTQPQCCLTFSLIEPPMLFRCYLIYISITETPFIFNIFVSMSRPASIYVVSM